MCYYIGGKGYELLYMCNPLTFSKDATESKVGEVKAALEKQEFSCWEATIGAPGVLFHYEDAAKL